MKCVICGEEAQVGVRWPLCRTHRKWIYQAPCRVCGEPVYSKNNPPPQKHRGCYVGSIPLKIKSTPKFKVDAVFYEAVAPFPPLSTNPGVKTYLVMNDHHIPFQHNECLKIVHTVASLAKVDFIILNGDIADCYEIGRFIHFTRQSLANEMKQVYTYLRKLRKNHPTAEIIYIAGNHEHRWSNYIHKNVPAMVGFNITAFSSALKLKKLKIKWVYSGQAESYYRIPGTTLYVGHFDRVNKFSAYTVKNLIEDKHVNIIQAHTHRGGTYYKSTIGQELVGYENFCLRTKEGTEYVMDPNW